MPFEVRQQEVALHAQERVVVFAFLKVYSFVLDGLLQSPLMAPLEQMQKSDEELGGCRLCGSGGLGQ